MYLLSKILKTKQLRYVYLIKYLKSRYFDKKEAIKQLIDKKEKTNSKYNARPDTSYFCNIKILCIFYFILFYFIGEIMEHVNY